ncbi:MAG: peptide chain release factor 2 [Chloroflexota bacterium]
MQEQLDKLTDMRQRVGSIMVRLDLPEKRERIAALEQESQSPDFWNDQQVAQAKMQELSNLKGQVTAWEEMDGTLAETHELIEISIDELSEEETESLTNEVTALTDKLDKMEFQIALSGKHDPDDAMVSISAGAGGTESQDWVEMLMRMYLRWGEARRFKTTILDQLEGDGAGLKSVTISIKGEYAFGYLRSERGVHRLVRISPFDANSRRHTSFALVEAVPDINNAIEIEINPDDLEIEVFRASGAGGQHVQKNSTAVRMKHIPTGVVVSCQNQRSQSQNRETALRILRGRLYDLEQKKIEEEQARLKGKHVEAGWGNQIRSYVLHPYKMVKDHRTSHEVGNAEGVLDGDLDGFIESYLHQNIGGADVGEGG